MKLRDYSLLLISLTVAALLVEGLLRLAFEPSSLYASFRTVPELNAWKNRVRFYERHRGSGVLPDNHDPLLGWDLDKDGDRIRGARRVSMTPQPGVRRIVAIGDSQLIIHDS